MTIYKAYFRTDAEYATREFDTATPEQALALARRLYDDDPSDLIFVSYGENMPVNEIEISGPDGGKLTLWRDEDLSLQDAARDLFEALQECSSFLAAASEMYERKGLRRLAAKLLTALSAARAAIAKAKGGVA